MHLKKLITFSVLFFFSYLIFFFFSKKERVIINDSDINSLKNYDLIITSGQSVHSKLLNLFRFSNQNYSHIGIVLKENNNIYVLHSTPDGTNDNGIRYDDLQSFIDLSFVNYYKILRFDTLTNIQNIQKKIEHYKKSKYPFDYKFDNKNKDEIYCSELIYDIYKEQGLEINKLNLDVAIHPKLFLTITGLISIIERKYTANRT
jgi:uncharacterized protein YycO